MEVEDILAMRKCFRILGILSLFAVAPLFVYCSDPSTLQDFCVAINNPQSAGITSFFVLWYQSIFIIIFFMLSIMSFFLGAILLYNLPLFEYVLFLF